MRLRSKRAIVAEYNRIKRLAGKLEGADNDEWYGARQALAWVLDDNAMAPAKALRPLKPKREGKP